MGAYFKHLPSDFPKWRIHEAVRDIVFAMRDDGGDLGATAKLALRVNLVIGVHVNPEAIRFLLKQEKDENSRVNTSNVTLAVLYDFIVSYHHRLGSKAKERFAMRHDDLCLSNGGNEGIGPDEDAIDGRFALGTQAWVHASPTEVDRLARKLSGNYVLLRKSTITSGLIMRSTLEVRLMHAKRTPYISVRHLYHDRYGKLRNSKGFFFPVVKNVYGPLQVEDHEGLEIIVIRDPVQASPSFFVGFMLGVNGNRTLYNSSVLLERMESDSTKRLLGLSHRFSSDDNGYADLDADLRGRLAGILIEPRSRLISDFE